MYSCIDIAVRSMKGITVLREESWLAVQRQKKAHIGLWAWGLQLAAVQNGWQQANVRTARSRPLR